MNVFTDIQWSPYVVGVGIGILSWFTWLISKKPIGCSTAYTRSAGIFARLFRRKGTEPRMYFKEVEPVIDWQWMLVLGIGIGALISSILSGDFQLQWIPSKWQAVFGSNLAFRLIIAFIGGGLLGFGSRWAGGCTSGHGISGTMLLSVASWISAVCFFIGGIMMAQLLFYVLPL